jgi:uncharacterized membrane protein YhaH (DUF805 family)
MSGVQPQIHSCIDWVVPSQIKAGAIARCAATRKFVDRSNLDAPACCRYAAFKHGLGMLAVLTLSIFMLLLKTLWVCIQQWHATAMQGWQTAAKVLRFLNAVRSVSLVYVACCSQSFIILTGCNSDAQSCSVSL